MSPTTQFRGKLTLARRSATASVVFELQPERQAAIQDCESLEREEFAPRIEQGHAELANLYLPRCSVYRTAATLIACGDRLGRPGKSGKKEEGQPDSRKSQLNGDGLKIAAITMPNPFTVSTKGSANTRISADEPSRGRP